MRFWTQVQNNSPKTLTLLDDGMSFSGCIAHFALLLTLQTIKRTFGNMACVLNC